MPPRTHITPDGRIIRLIDDLSEATGQPGEYLALPQFLNPEAHRPGCTLPDKMFRFCDCRSPATTLEEVEEEARRGGEILARFGRTPRERK